MVLYEDDILQPLTDNAILTYIDKLKTHLPDALGGHHFLIMQLRWHRAFEQMNPATLNSISTNCKYTVYVPKSGDTKLCTFVAITNNAQNKNDVSKFANSDGQEIFRCLMSINFLQDYMVYPFTLQTNNTELQECIYRTKRIKWPLGPIIMSLDTQQLPVISNFMAEHRLEIEINWGQHARLWLDRTKIASNDLEFVIKIVAFSEQANLFLFTIFCLAIQFRMVCILPQLIQIMLK